MTITVHFAQPGPQNTDAVIEAVDRYLSSEEPLDKIVVASTEGGTGLRFAQRFPHRGVIVVSHQSGFVRPNHNEMPAEMRSRIAEAGATVLTATHAFAGVGRGIRKTLGTWTINELLAVAYRTFGQGTKVCAEIVMMAADAGLVQVDRDVVAVGGTGHGADTAWVVRPAYTSDFPTLKMKACICRPLEF
ncbi:MAG: hypothetical protein HXY34_08930 [Candidatus Thorarchaeota archaeon]|nr:hypothetical protein [Candidatus Thorarchaeota archaeon]